MTDLIAALERATFNDPLSTKDYDLLRAHAERLKGAKEAWHNAGYIYIGSHSRDDLRPKDGYSRVLIVPWEER